MSVHALAGPARARAWWAARTLRTRLVAGLLALLVLTCSVVGVTTTLALRGFLVDRLDQQLPGVTGPVASWLHEGAGSAAAATGVRPGQGSREDQGGPDGQADPDDRGDQGDRGDLLDGDGAPLLHGQQQGIFGALLVSGEVSATSLATRDRRGTEVLVTPRLSRADLAAIGALPTSGRPATLVLDDVGTFRARVVVDDDGTMVVGLPTAGADAVTGRLVMIELVVFAVAVALAGLVGALFVRLSLRPLRRVAAAATAVAATPMGSGAVTLPRGVSDADERTEVGRVGSAFNAMIGQVGASLAQRQATEDRLRQFVADASHELRTPLAVIRGHSEMAGRQGASLPPDVAHALSRVNSESLRMGVLVDDLLLLARLDAGRPLAREEVDLTRLALDATSDAGAAERGRPGHRWRLDLPEEPVLVLGDGHRLHQVLANLLANARVHTPPGTEVTVRLSEPSCPGAPGDASPGRVELSVTDDGPGVPPEVAQRVFERFVRADVSRTRGDLDEGAAPTGSSGLGLAIVDAVVAAHGGTVDLQSAPGRTRFRVHLPRCPQPSQAGGEHASREHAAGAVAAAAG